MLKIGGIHKFSLIDFPSRISAVLFIQGCNLRCPYCHNRHLVLPEYFGYTIGIDEVFRFLESRKKMIEGIVISGGEPTIYKNIPEFIKKIKDLGYLVKLDTNGTNPEVLKNLIEEKLVDYVAMDIKGSGVKYEYLTGSSVNMDKIKKSVEILLQSDIEYEFRTTLIKDLLTYNDIIKIGQMIKGAKRYALQNFVPSENLIDKRLKGKTGFSEKERNRLKKTLKKYVKEIILR